MIVRSWQELQEQLFADSWQESLSRHRSPFAFRGHASKDDGLETSLSRLSPKAQELEAHLLRSFRKYAQRSSVPADSCWNWLALAQHHDLPTRMLDWTYSPFVALHFMTENADRMHVDGAVWMVNYAACVQYLPKALRAALEGEATLVFTVDLLSRVASSLADLDRMAPPEFLAFLEPPSFDDRIVNQFALFSLMPSPVRRVDDWLAERSGLVRKIIVPASLKWEIRDRLDQINLTERVLYPGLDGLSRWLRRYYGPRNAAARPCYGKASLDQGARDGSADRAAD